MACSLGMPNGRTTGSRGLARAGLLAWLLVLLLGVTSCGGSDEGGGGGAGASTDAERDQSDGADEEGEAGAASGILVDGKVVDPATGDVSEADLPEGGYVRAEDRRGDTWVGVVVGDDSSDVALAVQRGDGPIEELAVEDLPFDGPMIVGDSAVFWTTDEVVPYDLETGERRTPISTVIPYTRANSFSGEELQLESDGSGFATDGTRIFATATTGGGAGGTYRELHSIDPAAADAGWVRTAGRGDFVFTGFEPRALVSGDGWVGASVLLGEEDPLAGPGLIAIKVGEDGVAEEVAYSPLSGYDDYVATEGPLSGHEVTGTGVGDSAFLTNGFDNWAVVRSDLAFAAPDELFAEPSGNTSPVQLLFRGCEPGSFSVVEDGGGTLETGCRSAIFAATELGVIALTKPDPEDFETVAQAVPPDGGDPLTLEGYWSSGPFL